MAGCGLTDSLHLSLWKPVWLQTDAFGRSLLWVNKLAVGSPQNIFLPVKILLLVRVSARIVGKREKKKSCFLGNHEVDSARVSRCRDAHNTLLERGVTASHAAAQLRVEVRGTDDTAILRD